MMYSNDQLYELLCAARSEIKILRNTLMELRTVTHKHIDECSTAHEGHWKTQNKHKELLLHHVDYLQRLPEVYYQVFPERLKQDREVKAQMDRLKGAAKSPDDLA